MNTKRFLSVGGIMSTVTQRVREVKQPRGGYLKPSVFEKKVFYDGNTLLENECPCLYYGDGCRLYDTIFD